MTAVMGRDSYGYSSKDRELEVFIIALRMGFKLAKENAEATFERFLDQEPSPTINWIEAEKALETKIAELKKEGV